MDGMAYTTPEDVAARVNGGVDTTAGLPGSPSNAEQVSPEVIEAAIADADARIDSYLGSTYLVPFAPVPAQVAAWATAVAAWFATLALNVQADTGQNNPVRLRYEQAMADLNLARTGAIDVVGGLPPAATGGDDSPVYNRFPEMFNPGEFGVTFSGDVPQVGWPGYGNPFDSYGRTT